MRPAIRSTFDILHWMTARAASSGRKLDKAFILKMLYLCQAFYGAVHDRRKLMPATFLATGAGPIEPDVYLALENNFVLSEAVAPSAEVEKFLSSVWGMFQDRSADELDMVLSKDTALAAAKARGRNSEIRLEEMAKTYKNGFPSSFAEDSAFASTRKEFETGRSNLEAAPNSAQEVRFTADGRSVTKWTPSRRVVTRRPSVVN
ncbi:MAG: hypothetical protein EP348_02745 [Alphaproteobacteria bacterium]|nr:MAG: hypothetical protein EP348_02745 [Alphaproteobacteria bacterium]